MDSDLGAQYTLSTDPMIVLMQLECESVEDEFEVASLCEQRESVLLAAAHLVKSFSTKEF
jgi:hypothetical protein